MHAIPKNAAVEGIRQTVSFPEGKPVGWAVVLSYPISAVPGRYKNATVLGAEFRGAGAKAKAIKAAGTNRVVTP